MSKNQNENGVSRSLAVLVVTSRAKTRWNRANSLRTMLHERGIDVSPATISVTLDNLISQGLITWREASVASQRQEKGRRGRPSTYEFSITAAGEQRVEEYKALVA